ncbi:MAG: protein kinase [Labilithrix sp.]|nr:protein kinase [Labilithrix sp.]
MGVPSTIPPDKLLGGKFRLLRRIGRGGMGDVWIARNEATEAEVAVKTLVKSERTDVHDARFRREARLAATLSHRNVVRIFDLVDEEDGTLGLVMELLRGGTLEDCMRERGPMRTTEALAVALPILSALHHVHQKGIVHRDVKPANIFFAVEPDGHVIPKILDFGIAKLPAAGSALTVDGSVLGTPHYMSPEQIRGQEDLDGRSDMFSFAVLVYEMLTGTPAFQRDSAAASLAAVLEHEIDPDPRIEPRVWIAISRALAKRPYERYGSCAELADALRAAVDVTDEDYAQALQDLRPASDKIPKNIDGDDEAPMVRSRQTRRRKGATLWTIVAASAAAVVAATATFAVTRPGSTARADDAPPATSAGMTAAGPAPPTATVDPKPAPTPEPMTAAAPTSPGVPTPLSKPAGTTHANVSTASTLARPPPKPSARPGTKPVATSPGF